MLIRRNCITGSRKLVFSVALIAFIGACSGGDSSEDTGRPPLILDTSNAREIAISTLSDLDYFLELLFDVIVQVDAFSTSPNSLAVFTCSSGTESASYGGIGSTVVSGDTFSITLNTCVVGSSEYDGNIMLDLGLVSLAGDSFNGRIEFNDFARISSGTGASSVLDGWVDFGVGVAAGAQAIIVDDSNLNQKKHDGMPANEATENYKDLDLTWSSPGAGNLEIDVNNLVVDSGAFIGSFSVQTSANITRPVGTLFPTLGRIVFSSASNSSYALSADPVNNAVLEQSLDSDGDGEDVNQPVAPTWPLLFPEGFLLP